MGAHAFAVEGSGPGPAMRRRLAGFVVTLRDAGFYSEWKQKYGAEAWAALEKQVGGLG